MTEASFAAKIAAYWQQHGYRPKIELQTVTAEDFPKQRKTYTMPGVRSDLVNGLPRDWTAAVQSDLAIPARAR